MAVDGFIGLIRRGQLDCSCQIGRNIGVAYKEFGDNEAAAAKFEAYIPLLLMAKDGRQPEPREALQALKLIEFINKLAFDDTTFIVD